MDERRDRERIDVTGDDVRVSYDIRELFRDIKHTLEDMDRKLDAKADQTEVAALRLALALKADQKGTDELCDQVDELRRWQAAIKGGVAVALALAGFAVALVAKHYF